MAVNTRDGIGHIFTILQVTLEAEPVTHNVIGPLDQLGQLVDLARLDGESFKNYKHRVLDTYVHRANATYQGLINGITRELGLLQFDALTIDVKNGSGGLPESPRIVVASTEVILYNKWSGEDDYEIDKTINIYNRSGNTYNGFFMEDLVSEINSSTYFSATIGVNVDAKTHSITLLQQSSDRNIPVESVPSATNFKLEYGDITEESIFFDEVNVFRNLKAAEVDVVSAGDYYVNFSTGRVVVKTLPSGSGAVRYISRRMPYVVEASPISVIDFKDEKFRKEVFHTVILPDGTTLNGIPTPEAIDIINQLFSIKGMYWGE